MKNMTDLRETLFDTIDLLKQGKIEVDKARAISDISRVVVESAKTELSFIKETGGKGSGFIVIDPDEQPKLERPKAEYSNNGHVKVIDRLLNGKQAV